METVLLDIIAELKTNDKLNSRQLEQIIRKHNKKLGQTDFRYAKKELLPFYLKIKDLDNERFRAWGVDGALEQRLIRLLQMKPNRTASGVATITVITKPWPCSSNCLYCPNDVRMPKSYLSGEPACQRAERNFFDPYLQVVARLKALTDMGHITEKIELIILGGTWCDYSLDYQLWFMKELFRALNEGIGKKGPLADAMAAGVGEGTKSELTSEDEESEGHKPGYDCCKRAEDGFEQRAAYYRLMGFKTTEDELQEQTNEVQQAVNNGSLTYNKAVSELYGEDTPWRQLDTWQHATLSELQAEQRINETAAHRMVGLVVETRPDTITAESLTLLRQMGCTKIQMGVQSLDPVLLRANKRTISIEAIQRAFALVRLFGFKIQAHFMLNLKGATPEADKVDFRHFVEDAPYQPDETKLYPCSLVEGAELCKSYEEGSWQPYTEEELMEVLIHDSLATPCYVRISRMIRDISAEDIVVGNKKANLRQMVEAAIEAQGDTLKEIRSREIRTSEITLEHLELKDFVYETTVSTEHFLEWVTPENRIAGFLRLSLPKQELFAAGQATIEPEQLPTHPQEAMIREVHIYGKVAKLNTAGEDAQHVGLGKQLIEEASRIAAAHGYEKMNVISSVGTREYYRSLGFEDKELYQQKAL